ncbi:MAG: DUF1080 domain-containing protein [Fimbriimonadaceae bacterium]|nr:DUF1080 domain-containing protein [Fimbriimonadaceae bacterium]
MRRWMGLCAALALWAGGSVLGQAPATTPAEAGPDWELQGEYLGVARRAGAETRLAALVAARGGGKFTVTFLPGGLPGDGWDNTTKATANGNVVDKIVLAVGEGYAAQIADGQITGTTPNDGSMDLKKVDRSSPTLGAKAPNGAVVLFDGSNVDAWAKGSLDPRGWLAVWTGNQGVRAGAVTKQGFQSFKLHLEFMTPFMPAANGQGRANSGVYLQDRYEVQVLDSFGLKVGKGTGNGDVAGDIYSKAGAATNACRPPLTWQTYDIEFTAATYAGGQKTANARATVRLNGVLLHDQQEISAVTGGNGHGEGPEAAPLMLQDHGYPVFYRNIWLVPLP